MKPIRIELPTSFAIGSVNAYLFRQPEPVLVDTGIKSADSWNALISGLAEHGLRIADLAQVIITHPHVDHFGQANMIAGESSADIRVSELGKQWLVDFPDMWRRRIAYYRDHFMGFVGFEPDITKTILDYMEQVVDECDPVPEDRVSTFTLEEKLELGGQDWQVIHMPGHASHQTCFYQCESRLMVSADMLLAKAPTPIVERPTVGTERAPSLPRFMKSLSIAESLEIDMVYPGHGVPFTDHRRIIQAQRDRIEKRKRECLRLVNSGCQTVADLVNVMYAHLPVQFRFAGLWMLVGYLDLLMQEGAVLQEEQGGVWHYKAISSPCEGGKTAVAGSPNQVDITYQ